MTEDMEQQVLATVDHLIESFASDENESYFSCFTPEATFIFHNYPEVLYGTEAYRTLWETWKTESGFRVRNCISRERNVKLFPGLAIFTHMVETETSSNSGTNTSLERETIIFVQRGSRWLAVHEHLSMLPSQKPSEAMVLAPIAAKSSLSPSDLSEVIQ